jgi:hypothetical protein
MSKIFVNLPVEDLARSEEFFTAIGFTFDPALTDGKAACMVISDDIYVMLLTEDYFRTFTGKSIADTSTSTEAMIAVLLDSRQDVDRVTEAALAGGAQPVKETEEQSPMYTRAFYDLDGHHWELFHA